MRSVILYVVTALSLLAAVPYLDIHNVERAVDRRFDNYSVSDPIELVGGTHGVYIEGSGAVFTSEVNLVLGPVLSPMHQEISKEEIAKVRERKKARLPELRKLMQATLVSSATGLATMPPQEEIVYGVTLFNMPWEDATGLPHQIVMRAKRQALLDFEKGTLKTLEAAVKTQTY
jgi:hypothetical protein